MSATAVTREKELRGGAVIQDLRAWTAFVQCSLCDAKTPSFLSDDHNGDKAATAAKTHAIEDGWRCLRSNGATRFRDHWVCEGCAKEVRA